MSQPRVVMLDETSAADRDFYQSLAGDGFAFVAPEEASQRAALLAEADYLIARTEPVTADTLASAPNVRLVQKYGGRRDRIDLDAARARGVAVAVMPLRGCIAVAELTMALILALSKQLVEAHQATAEGRYRALGLEPRLTSQRTIAFQWMQVPNLQEIAGKTLGIVGFGEIGTEVAKRARSFDMDVVYAKRQPLPDELDAELGVRPAPLETVLATADFVTIHVPHGPGTDPLIGERELDLMKPAAYLVNTCRGPVVDETALIAALVGGHIAGAGLDVFREEPLPFDNPLTRLPNVILTPHIGGGTGGAREKQMADVLANIARHANGEEPRHRVA
jgi:phosphoglycerate dehydrogenase-like enzyme